MPLDLTHISRQIDQLAEGGTGGEYWQNVAEARVLMRSIEPEELRAKFHERRRRRDRLPWLEAYVPRTLVEAFNCPALPRDFGVAAADGSDIPPDRHSPAHFCIVNTGRVWLQYGARPAAELTARARMYVAEDLWLIGEDDQAYVERPVEGALLSARRAVDEMRALWEICQGRDVPLVALSDGALVLWQIQTESRTIREQILHPFFEVLERFRAARIPVASYISRTGSQDVVNALRSFVCQETPIHCTRCRCPAGSRLLSLALKEVRDDQVFDFLAPGWRSEVFETETPILKEYGRHSVQFFYLNVGGEVVRIEAPQWLMRDDGMLNFVHAAIFDQCRRSGTYPPYPPVLQEAHEQAVIHASDRLIVEQMVEEAIQRQGTVYVRGAKDRSKRLRAI